MQDHLRYRVNRMRLIYESEANALDPRVTANLRDHIRAYLKEGLFPVMWAEWVDGHLPNQYAGGVDACVTQGFATMSGACVLQCPRCNPGSVRMYQMAPNGPMMDALDGLHAALINTVGRATLLRSRGTTLEAQA